MTQSAPVTNGAALVHVKFMWLFWLSTCSCGRYRKRHVRWGAAMKDADVHAATHNLRVT